MLSTANLTMQFGAKALFENVSVEFGNGNRYGLIGANGSGKTTLMKILGGDLEPSSGHVSLSSGERLGKLRQDQFAFEECTVLDTVIMGHAELWRVKQERDRLYALPEMTDEEGMAVAHVEVEFADHLKRYYWSKPVFWSRSYCILTVGGAPLSVLKQYIEQQERPE